MASHRNRSLAQKTARAKERREKRFAIKREEKKDPSLRAARLEKNKPRTLDQKRVWDDVDDDELTSSVDLQALRRKRMRQAEDAEREAAEAEQPGDTQQDEDDADSMLDFNEDEDEDEEDAEANPDDSAAQPRPRQNSLAPSITSTNIDITPESLLAKFPSLFSENSRPAEPKILITTSLNSTLHAVAEIFQGIIPNSKYVPRSAHHYGHKYSVREIAKFAENQGFSSLLIIREDNKKPIGLDIVDLPSKVTFHFSISSWIEGKKLPHHGNATNHYPELLLNNFATPLGLVTAKTLQSLFPQTPELGGRQTVMFHNSRDYIFFRRHRYIIREKKATEKSVVGADGQEMKGVENIRAGLQELGPRFTLKLRRIDKGVGRAGSDPNDPLHWQWQAKMEKNRKRFNL
ncbi:Brix-domain-containing protein [Astrocystis sublimbata]|nr:Brix-domain-containing protein [Astrocystis sublimbata]